MKLRLVLLFSLVVAVIVPGWADAATRYVDNTLVASGLAQGTGSTTTIVIDADVLTAGSLASFRSVTNGLRNYSITVTSGTGSGTTSHKIDTGTVNGSTGVATLAISPTSFSGTTDTTSVFEIRYGSDRNTGASATISDTSALTTTGPKLSISGAYLDLDHGLPSHIINVKSTGSTYTESTTSGLTGTFDELYLVPAAASASQTGGGPISSTTITAYQTTVGDLLSVNSAITEGGNLVSTNFPLILPNGSAASGPQRTIEMASAGTSAWSVTMKCFKVRWTGTGSKSVIYNSSVAGSLTFDACIIGSTTYADGNDQTGLWDVSATGTSKSFTFTRSQIWSTLACVRLTCGKQGVVQHNDIRLSPHASGSPAIWIDNGSADSDTYVKKCIVEHNRIFTEDVAGNSADVSSLTSCPSVYPQGMNYGDRIRITNNTIFNHTRSQGVFIGSSGPNRIDVADNTIHTSTASGASGGIAIGADASVENPANPTLFNLYRVIASGAIISSTNGASSSDSGTDTVVINTGTASYSSNDLKGFLIIVNAGPGRGHQRMITANLASSGSSPNFNTSLTVNPSWTGTPYDINTTPTDGSSVAPPPTSSSTYQVLQRIPGQTSVRGNFCVQDLLPTNYSNNLNQTPVVDAQANAHSLLIGQGVDSADISGNIFIGGDNGIVLKSEHCTVTNNVVFSGRGTCLIKGGSFNFLSHNTFICGLHAGGSGCVDLNDKSSFGGAPDAPLEQIYPSKCVGNVFTDNICAVVADNSGITTGYTSGVSFLVDGHNQTPIIVDNTIGTGSYQGSLSMLPAEQSNRFNNNFYYHFDPSDSSSGQIFFLGGTGYTSFATYAAAWAALESNATDYQYWDNETTSHIATLTDENFLNLGIITDNLSDLSALTADDVRYAVSLTSGCDAIGAATNLSNIGAIQESHETRVTGRIRDLSGSVCSGVVVTFAGIGGDATYSDITDTDGIYSVVLPNTWDGTVTPNSGSFTFSPGSIDIGSDDLQEAGTLLNYQDFQRQSGASSSYVLPVSSTTHNVTVQQASASPNVVWTVTDSAGTAINLAGKTVRLIVEKNFPAPNPTLFQLQSGGSGLVISGVSSNVVTATYSTTNTASAGVFRYFLYNVTDSQQLVTGIWTIQRVNHGS